MPRSNQGNLERDLVKSKVANAKRPYLLYVLVNYRTKEYLEMLFLYLKSLLQFSPLASLAKLDLLVICDEQAKKDIEKKWKDDNWMFSAFNRNYFLVVKRDPSLQYALLRKCDIAHFPHFLEYSKILYMDIDVIVVDDILKVFKNVKRVKDDVLYAAKEGDIEGKFWYLNSYKNTNVAALRREGVHSFNTGLFLFKPSVVMRGHFLAVKKFALDYYKEAAKHPSGRGSFSVPLDQSFFNYYFNMHRLTNTEHFNEIYKMFPEKGNLYPGKIILHFAGIGDYKNKGKRMQEGLNMLGTSANNN